MDGHDMEVGFHGHTTNSHVIKYGHKNHNRNTTTGVKEEGSGKKLTIVVILLSILCFGLIAYVLVTGPLASLLQPDSGGYIGICDSVECVGISHRSIESGDFNKNPCDDFYAFACSKWQNNNPASQELFLSAANMHQIKDHVDFYIKRLLEKPEEMRVNGTTGFHVYSSPNAFYESCLNFSPPEESRIISDLIKPLGGYKTLATWSEQDFDLTSTVLTFLRLNAAPLFDLTLDIDPRDKTKYALIVELPRPTSLVPNLLQPKSRQEDVFMSDKLNSDLTEASNNNPLNISSAAMDVDNGNHDDDDLLYPTTLDRQVLYKMITENVEIKRVERLRIITQQIGKMNNLRDNEIQQDSESISTLASTIENIKPSQRSRKFWKQQNKVYNAFSLESLQRLFNNVDWKQLLERLLGQKRDGSSGRKIQMDNFSWENLTLYVPYPDYLRRLSQAIQFTDKRTLLNGMLVMYVKDMLNDLIPKKKGETEPRWKFCVHSTKSVFAMEMSSLYMRSFDPALLSGIKNDVENIFENVRETLLNFLNQSHWQDTRSRDESIKKIKSLKGSFIGADFYLKSDYLEDVIKNEIKVQIDPKNFLANVQLVYKIFRKQLYAQYVKKVDVERATWAFVTFPTTVNAFYIQQFNSLVIPLAFLNPPNYYYGAPKSYNYATIALTIAHEALHSLDSSGSDFNADGKLINHGMNNNDQGGFLKEKSSCVSKQYYDMFRKIIPFHHSSVNMYFQVDGNLTQNENLADIAGLQVALKAYQNYLEKYDSTDQLLMEKMKLPGLNLTARQIYFLSVAQAYCANISPMGYIFLLEMDEHTPHPERINGMLMNIPEFASAFRCRTGSRMNPSSKCSLW